MRLVCSRSAITKIQAAIIVVILVVAVAVVAWYYYYVPPTAPEEKTIEIGFPMTLTGAGAPAGKGFALTADIWENKTNDEGGLWVYDENGELVQRPVEMVYYDDKMDTALVPTIYTKLITEDKVDFVMGCYGGAWVTAGLPVAEENNMVYLQAGGITKPLMNNTYPYDFCLLMTGDDAEKAVISGFYRMLETNPEITPKPETVAIIGLQTESAVTIVDGAVRLAQELGYQIVYGATHAESLYPWGVTDYDPIISKIKALNPDIFIAATFPADLIGIVESSKRLNFVPKAYWVGFGGCYTTFRNTLGTLANNIFTISFWLDAPPFNTFSEAEYYATKFKDQAVGLGIDPLPNYITGNFYAAFQILGTAINSTHSLDQTVVGDYIRTHTFLTIVGPVTFSELGNAPNNVILLQYRSVTGKTMEDLGDMIIIEPSAYATGKPVYPFPGWG